ncbi:hypothetical protein ACYSNU_18760 [Enterococcus sp. LJL120]|nr:hypothetical protein [Enterococcus sp. HY326]
MKKIGKEAIPKHKFQLYNLLGRDFSASKDKINKLKKIKRMML